MAWLYSKIAFALISADIVYQDEQGNIIETPQAPIWPVAWITALCVILGLVCIALVVVILLQKKRASGIGAAIAGSGETYFSKNKGKTFEGTLESYTKWGGAAFIVIALVINIFL